MPELPEVETVRRGLNRVTLNKSIQGGEVLLERSISHPLSASAFLTALTGCQVREWQRRGKYLLAPMITSTGIDQGYLGVHLRMTGQLLWLARETPLQTHCRVRLWFETDQELRFVDQRTFGRMWWVPPNTAVEEIMTGLQRLGPEPFDPDFSGAYLRAKLRRCRRPIKNALLDQALVAGIGNIYADEALFLSGIRPTAWSDRLGPQRLQKLHAAICQVLTASIEAGGTTFSDYRDIYGINGNYGGVAWVYNRDRQPCRVCGTEIQRIKLAGRSAHYCPTCQR